MAEKKRARGFDLRQLECFCALARAGSFTKAAEELGIAQPSLSEQIARLELARIRANIKRHRSRGAVAQFAPGGLGDVLQ